MSGHKRHRDTGTMELDMSSSTFSSSSATLTDEPIDNSSSISVLPSTPLGITATLRTQLEQLERDREALQSGTLGIYTERCALFESVRADALARAATQRRHEIEAAQRAFAFAEHAAISTCSTACSELRAAMNREINDRELEIKNALARLSGGTISSSVHATNSSSSSALDAALGVSSAVGGGGGGAGAGGSESLDPISINNNKVLIAEEKGSKSQRLLRSKRNKEDAVGAAASATTGSGGVVGTISGGVTNADGRILSTASSSDTQSPGSISISLPPAEALADMRSIYRDWKEIAHRWRAKSASALLHARVELGKLLYDSLTFSKGDSVSVFSELTKQEYVGELFALSQTEVLVKIATGGPKPTGLRIPLVHLRHGRVSMAHYSTPTAAAQAQVLSSSFATSSNGVLSSMGDDPIIEPRLKTTSQSGSTTQSKRPSSLATLLAVGSTQTKVNKPSRPPIKRERAAPTATALLASANTVASSTVAVASTAPTVVSATTTSASFEMVLDGSVSSVVTQNEVMQSGTGTTADALSSLYTKGLAQGGGTVQEALLASAGSGSSRTTEQPETIIDRMNIASNDAWKV